MTDARHILENFHFRLESTMEANIIRLMHFETCYDEYYLSEDECVRPMLRVVDAMRDSLDEFTYDLDE